MSEAPKPKSAPNSIVKAESALQLALAIPAGCFTGLLIGYLLDRHFHAHWMTMTGLFLGAAGGFIQVFSSAARMIKRGDD